MVVADGREDLMDDENEVIYVGVEDMNANVEGGVVPDTRSTAVKRSGGIIIACMA